MLKSAHGTVIIKKDTILYHATDEEFSYRPDSQLRTVFHPSEWTGYDYEYIVKIRLKCDIEVLFWITGFKKHYVLSNQTDKKSKDFLEQIKNSKSFNLLCSNDKVILTEQLRQEKLDGWFSSIENRSHVEVAIANDPAIFEAGPYEPLRKNWRNGNCLGGSETSKNWGEAYPVSSRTLPLVFHLNAQYKPLIEVRSRIDVSARICAPSHFRKCDNKLFGPIIKINILT